MGFIPEWAIGVGFVMIIITVGRVISSVIRSSSRVAPGSDAEVGELRQTVEALQTRVGELEERLDFAERLLAKNRDADRLGAPPRYAGEPPQPADGESL